mmetsp:Transcript_14864/g.20363  ORF Transcript_14864/g.20363 Transcript_14864/m.20363 type:complete len:331 (-) Transcript_14864:313-1305(-)
MNHLQAQLCPCIILGQLRTKTSRESECLQFCSIGRAGCYRCLYTSLFSCFLYPLSPCLGLYLCHEREKLNVVYKNNSQLRHHSTWEKIVSVICWEKSLQEQKLFLQSMEENKTLVYDWDIKAYKDHLQIPSPEISTVRIFIYGPQSKAKMNFFVKLLHYNEAISPNIGTTESQSLAIKENYERIPIGVKSLLLKQNVVKCLEIWNVTETSMNSYSVRHHLPSIDAIIYFFDGTNSDDSIPILFPDTFRVQDQIIEHQRKCICVVALNAMEPVTFHHGSRSSFGHHNKVNPKLDSLEKVRLWAHDHHCTFLTICMNENKGLATLYNLFNTL